MSLSDVPQFVRCLKCKKIIKCSIYDPSNLLQHIQVDHPDLHVQSKGKLLKTYSKTLTNSKTSKRSSSLNNAVSEKSSGAKRDIPEKTGFYRKKLSSILELAGLGGASQSVVERESQPVPTTSTTDSDDEILHSDEKDKTTDTTMVDETHSDNAVAKNRKYRSSVQGWDSINGVLFCPCCSSNLPPRTKTRAQVMLPCCAPCLLSIWPICRLPCFIDEHNFYLYCPNCSTFLGLYNDETHSIRPNKHFVDGAEDGNSEYFEAPEWHNSDSGSKPVRGCGCSR